MAKRMTGHVAAMPQARPAVPGATAATRPVVPSKTAWRYRYQVIPFAWLAWMLAAGPLAHLAGLARPGVLAGIASGVLTWLVTRHLKGGGRRLAEAMAAVTALWVPVLALAGWTAPLPPLFLACWAAVLVPWLRRYRWRRQEAEAAPVPNLGDAQVWDKLAAKNKWSGRLETCTPLPGGGRQWAIRLEGSETHIGEVMAQPRKVAAAYGKAITEAYVEPAPDGVESRGLLTILPRSALDKPRQWDGTGIDLETGLAVVGRFPDGQPVHERYFILRNGVRHTLTAGADGSGKTGLLDLGLCLSARSGIIAPVILDPQEGQALPAWQGCVPYARGAEECLAFLFGLHAAMLDRSKYLATLPWAGPDGGQRTGMGFFDPFLTGLPIVEVTVDESPALLAHPVFGSGAAYLLGEIGKLGRKAGFRIRLAVQHPSLAELGGHPPLRSMLVGGNVFCGRTGDGQTQGMIGVKGDPRQIPKYFRDGSPTVGLGYADGPDNRPSTPARWDYVADPYAVAADSRIRGLDERCLAVMDKTAKVAPEASPALAAVPDDEPSAPGRSCADAIAAVLTAEMDRGEVIKRAGKLVTESWGRERPFSVRSFTDALNALMAEGRIQKTGTGVYAPVRASLTVVTGTGGTAAGSQ